MTGDRLQQGATARERGSRRDPAIDALRGMALLGILVVNLPFFAMPYGFAGSWWKQDDPFHLGTLAAFLIQALFENKFILIFAFLFGMGAAGQIAGSGTGKFAVRMLAMAVLGLLNAIFVFEADILLPYALVGLLLLPVQRCSTRMVLTLAALLWAVAIVNHALFAIHLASSTPAPGLAQEARIALFRDGDILAIAGQRLHDWIGFSRYNLIVLIPMTASAFCFGIAAFRERERAAGYPALKDVARLLLWPALLGNGVYAALNLAPASWANGHVFLASLVLRPVFAPLLSLVIFAYLMELLSSARHVALRDFFAASGRMSLSIYVLQGLAGSVLFFGYGFGLYAGLGLPAVFALSLLLSAALAALAASWTSRFGAGPLERLLARLLAMAARRPEPSRRQAAAEAGPISG